jgi:hypothetical protein
MYRTAVTAFCAEGIDLQATPITTLHHNQQRIPIGEGRNSDVMTTSDTIKVHKVR